MDENSTPDHPECYYPDYGFDYNSNNELNGFCNRDIENNNENVDRSSSYKELSSKIGFLAKEATRLSQKSHTNSDEISMLNGKLQEYGSHISCEFDDTNESLRNTNANLASLHVNTDKALNQLGNRSFSGVEDDLASSPDAPNPAALTPSRQGRQTSLSNPLSQTQSRAISAKESRASTPSHGGDQTFSSGLSPLPELTFPNSQKPGLDSDTTAQSVTATGEAIRITNSSPTRSNEEVTDGRQAT
ncbi:hypothetical protein FLAG1_07449 [Fusarium langsethiae]|uniref:Uncharacterized protein n=1 Tax=Fusarium langsethiae TaxID=179993 RepID=A0A0N1J2J4_FUSLA|nr:hypothetical protein FLAG1_07449 [Fusarium langsethiae]GKU03770.1 unnamed protein product [Fusarium langsethiae]GKU19271.1 unnamed protein product [Fusarium langsethiae]